MLCFSASVVLRSGVSNKCFYAVDCTLLLTCFDLQSNATFLDIVCVPTEVKKEKNMESYFLNKVSYMPSKMLKKSGHQHFGVLN